MEDFRAALCGESLMRGKGAAVLISRPDKGLSQIDGGVSKPADMGCAITVSELRSWWLSVWKRSDSSLIQPERRWSRWIRARDRCPGASLASFQSSGFEKI